MQPESKHLFDGVLDNEQVFVFSWTDGEHLFE